jgi:cyclophilin family peptidyl-prolyl cis-trans isomerase
MDTQHSDSAVNRWQKPRDREHLAEVNHALRARHMIMTIGLAIAVIALIVIVAVARSGGKAPVKQTTTPPVAKKAAPPAQPAVAELPTNIEDIRKMESNPANPVIKITTSKGNMLVELYEDKVPNTVANMIELADKGFYKGMSFHRIIPGFMAQGGCPNSKKGAAGMPGTGGPGYTFADEFDPSLKHTGRGILSMANAGPNTNGSQFFICFESAPHLDGKHSVFGKVIAGADVLDELEKIGTPTGQPTETVRFNIEVVAKQDHPYQVKKR